MVNNILYVMENEIVDLIKGMCGEVEYMSPLGWHFMFNERHYFYARSNGLGLIRFCIPHLFTASDYDEAKLTAAINETNRNVKYIKVVVLECGSVSLGYDHKIIDGEQIENIIPHMIKALDFASQYLIDKLNRI